MVCENLISTKGFNNNIVFVNGESISVIIGSVQELTKEQVAQIHNIISRELLLFKTFSYVSNICEYILSLSSFDFTK